MEDQFGFVETLATDNERHSKYHRLALESVQEVANIFDNFADKSSWKLECDRSDIDMKCWSRPWKKDKIFAVEAIFAESAETVNKEVWENFVQGTAWDPSIQDRKILFPLGQRSQVVYQLMADILPVIKGRDFVGTRTWREINGSIIQAGQSVEPPEMPPIKGKVRAVSHLTGIKMTNLGAKRCKVEDVVCIDMKGYIPKFAVHAMNGMMLTNQLELLRSHMSGEPPKIKFF